ncbi:MAG TPA: ribosome-associated translation inhibitor RaiA [Vicinamibacterales bacterium]|nr:ribosome-associated translation inhibitor RaiA [Vicinamibacterales bacterium]
MRLELTGRHVEITPSLRRLVEMKLAKLERLLNDSAVSAQAVLTREKHRHRAEITLHARGEKFLHSVGTTASWEESLADAMEKLGQQAQKVKGKWQARKRRGPKGQEVEGENATAAAGPTPRERVRMPRILHASRQALKAMSVSDAAREVDADGDSVIVFRDTETAAISVLYRRRNGDLTLVQTEV